MMVEFAVRLAIAAGWVTTAVLLRPETAENVGKLAALMCAIAFFVLQLSRNAMRGEKASLAIGCTDSILVASALAMLGVLDSLGFLALAPIAFAASQHGATPSAMAPIAAGGVIAASMLWGKSPLPSLTLWVQAGAILVTGLLLNHRRVIVTVAQPVLPEAIEPIHKPEPADTLELRESYRRLKEMYKDLEGRALHDHMAVQLMQSRILPGDRFAKQLAMQLRDLIGVDGLAIYQVAQFDQRFVVSGTSGDYPSDIRDTSIAFDLNASIQKIQNSSAELLRSSLSPEAREVIVNCIVRHEGRMVAMVALTHREPGHLHEAADIVDKMEPWIASLMVQEQARIRHSQRLHSAELMYQLVSHLTGAKTATHLAARCAKVMGEWMEVDHLSFHWLDETGEVTAVSSGTPLRMLDAIQFATGPGLTGWIRLGAPAVWMPEVHEDERVAPHEATKRRIGSFAIVPIQFGETPFGFFTMATHRSGGIDTETWALAGAICQELSLAIARAQNLDTQDSGMATSAEFQAATQETTRGQIVYFQPVRKEQLIETYGAPMFEKAVRELAQKIRLQLPANAILTRRNEGDFVALLRNVSTEFAETWANRVAASSALIGLGPFASAKRMPLPIRAKVAAIQRDQAVVEALPEAVVQSPVFPKVEVKTKASKRKSAQVG